jgi:hypothetical protein
MGRTAEHGLKGGNHDRGGLAEGSFPEAWMDVGRDNGGVVDRSYADRAPFAFNGVVKKVVFDVSPHLGEGTSRPFTRKRPGPTRRGASAPERHGTIGRADEPVARSIFLVGPRT